LFSRSLLFSLIALLAMLASCTRSGGDSASNGGASATSLAASTKVPATKGSTPAAAVIDFLGASENCSFGHRGVLIDLGDATTRSRMSGAKLAAPDLDTREHEGASWVGVRTRSLELSFVSTAELKSEAGVVVEMRARGGAAKSASVYLNGKPIGSVSFTKGETTIVSTRAPGVVPRGTNELLLRFGGTGGGGSGGGGGGGRSHSNVSSDQLVEIDWIRVGANDGDMPYSAPTRGDAITTVAIGAGAGPNTSKRAVSLRAPGFARCSAFIPNGSMLEGFVGVTGGEQGLGSAKPEADAEVRVLVDRSEPRVIGTFHLGGGDSTPGWRPISLPLGDIGTIAGIELVAKNSSKGARVAFAEARVVPATNLAAQQNDDGAGGPKADSPLKARGVILVVMGSMSRRLLALHGGTIQMPELSSLASGGGIIFDAHRATSSWASGALGSMLTGVSPRQHGASDGDAALASSVVTIAEAARQAGVVTAMFTANPSTTAPYGFSRGWETFVARLPGDAAAAVAAAAPASTSGSTTANANALDAGASAAKANANAPAANAAAAAAAAAADPSANAATLIFEDAGRWLDAHKEDRFFLVVHARGGHPPWDVTSEELKELPPANYQGSLEPKHAGEALAKAKKAGNGRLFADPDRERAFALHGKALAAHDAALGALVARMKTNGRSNDTVWIVTGDIGVDAAAHVPFLEEESLEEGALSVPLVLHAPTKGPRERVPTATSGMDVAPTILEAFGLPPPPHLRGESLWSIAASHQKKAGGGAGAAGTERPLIAATTTRFSARWGAFAVVGAKEREVKVCNLSLDPDCVSDVRPSHPLAAEVLHSLAWNELVGRGRAVSAPPPKSSHGSSSSSSSSSSSDDNTSGSAGSGAKHTDDRPTGGGTSSSESASGSGSSGSGSGSTRAVADGPTSAALRIWGR
jgi:arylsulfatase A-like enzyme